MKEYVTVRKDDGKLIKKEAMTGNVAQLDVVAEVTGANASRRRRSMIIGLFIGAKVPEHSQNRAANGSRRQSAGHEATWRNLRARSVSRRLEQNPTRTVSISDLMHAPKSIIG
jgi:hypothetical protein